MCLATISYFHRLTLANQVSSFQTGNKYSLSDYRNSINNDHSYEPVMPSQAMAIADQTALMAKMGPLSASNRDFAAYGYNPDVRSPVHIGHSLGNESAYPLLGIDQITGSENHALQYRPPPQTRQSLACYHLAGSSIPSQSPAPLFERPAEGPSLCMNPLGQSRCNSHEGSLTSIHRIAPLQEALASLPLLASTTPDSSLQPCMGGGANHLGIDTTEGICQIPHAFSKIEQESVQGGPNASRPWFNSSMIHSNYRTDPYSAGYARSSSSSSGYTSQTDVKGTEERDSDIFANSVTRLLASNSSSGSSSVGRAHSSEGLTRTNSLEDMMYHAVPKHPQVKNESKPSQTYEYKYMDTTQYRFDAKANTGMENSVQPHHSTESASATTPLINRP